MSRSRFQPLSSELGGYIKTFLIIYGIYFLIIFFAGGAGKWSMYAGFGLGFILTVITYFFILHFTGVKKEKQFAPQQHAPLTKEQFLEMFK